MPQNFITVTPRYSGEDIENMLRRLKRKVKQDNRLLDIKKHEFFIRPGEIKRQKQRRSRYADGTPIEWYIFL